MPLPRTKASCKYDPKIEEIVREGCRILAGQGKPQYTQDARQLLSHLLSQQHLIIVMCNHKLTQLVYAHTLVCLCMDFIMVFLQVISWQILVYHTVQITLLTHILDIAIQLTASETPGYIFAAQSEVLTILAAYTQMLGPQ